MVLLTIFLITACKDSEKSKLDNRAIDYWNYKINKDFKSAYQFLSPGWKTNESELAYEQRMGGSKANWLNVKLKSKQCSQTDLCSVTVLVEYEYKFRGAVSRKMKVESSVSENWIMKDNIWYHIPVKKKIGNS